MKYKHRRLLKRWLIRGAITLALLTLPIIALVQRTDQIDIRIPIGYLALISIVTFWLYYSDKRRAQRSEWRIPEYTLHLVSLLGGWVMAFLAQQFLRHKNRKLKFQFVYWSTVLAHQLLCYELISDWFLSNALLNWIRPN